MNHPPGTPARASHQTPRQLANGDGETLQEPPKRTNSDITSAPNTTMPFANEANLVEHQGYVPRRARQA